MGELPRADGGRRSGLIHLFDWSGLINTRKGLGDTFQVPNLETGKMEKLITGDDAGALTALEEEQFRNMVNRLHEIFKYAKEQNVRVMVDAELELDPQERVLCFAQLLGMCDQITFPLG